MADPTLEWKQYGDWIAWPELSEEQRREFDELAKKLDAQLLEFYKLHTP